MKNILIVLSVIFLGGCTTYGWVAPQGKSDTQISLDQQYCQDSSYKKYPKKMITEMIEPAKIIPAHQSCKNIKKQEPFNCKTVNNKMNCDIRDIVVKDCVFIDTRFIDATYQTRDVNEKERDSDLKLCLQSKGYKWSKLED